MQDYMEILYKDHTISKYDCLFLSWFKYAVTNFIYDKNKSVDYAQNIIENW